MSDLPPGWESATLEELTDPIRPICYGILMPKDHVDDGVPYVKVKDFSRGPLDVAALRRTAPEIAEKYQRSSLVGGDVLISIRGTYGRVAIAPESLTGGNITQDTARVAPVAGLDRDYLSWFLQCPEAQGYFRRVARGVAVKGVNIGDLKQLAVPLAPLAEQERIVHAIEEHLSRLDAGVGMTHAAEGHAVALERSIVARLWDEPCELMPLGDIAEVIAGPAFRSAEFVPEGDGVRLLRGDNIEPGSLRWKGARCWPHERLGGLDHLYVESGDLILAMDRPVISSGLKLAFVQPVDLPALLVQRVARIRIGPRSDGRFVYRLLQHPAFIRHLLEGQTGTQVPHVTLDAIRSFRIPVPELERQRHLSSWCEGVLEALARTRNVISNGRRRADVLRRSVLAAAFSGQLVPQDPDDELASMLLDRVRAERAAAKRTRKAKAS